MPNHGLADHGPSHDRDRVRHTEVSWLDHGYPTPKSLNMNPVRHFKDLRHIVADQDYR
jgi:hypothetical protein